MHLGNAVKFQVVAIIYEIKEPKKLRLAVKQLTARRGIDLRLSIEKSKQELKVADYHVMHSKKENSQLFLTRFSYPALSRNILLK